MFQDIEIIEEINDESLFLRKISKKDAKFILKWLKDENITNYMSLGPLSNLESSKRLLNRYLKYWSDYFQFNYIIERREVKNIIKLGSISLWNISWRHKRAEIGIWIASDYWNQGIGEKAINLIKIIAFYHLKLNRLEAHISVKNFRSITLFKKCGFIEEGKLREYLHFKGIYQDAIILSYLKNNKN
jgi:ribosomal-protein-alanine N-acetyltransferase